MERDKEEVLCFVLETISKDPYYNDDSQESENLRDLEVSLKNGVKLTGDQKEILTQVLSSSASTQIEKIKNKEGSSLLLEIDVLSIYSDAYGLYCMKG